MTLEELNALEAQRIKDSRVGWDTNVMGGATSEDALALRNAADGESMGSLVQRGFHTFNAAAGINQWVDRAGLQPDPEFKLADHWDTLKQGLPMEYWDEFKGVQSYSEAAQLKMDIQQELDDKNMIGAAGSRGIVAAGLAGIVDIDAPLMLMSGGSYLAPKVGETLARTGLVAGRVRNALMTGAAGMEAGLLTETGNYMARPTGHWTDIPNAGLGGLVFGGALGSLSKAEMKANEGFSSMREDFHESVADGSAGRMDFTQPFTAPTDKTFEFGKSSVGAAQTKEADTFNEGAAAASTIDRRAEAQKYLTDANFVSDKEFAFGNGPFSKAASKFYNVLAKSPFATDWDRLVNSNSSIAAALAHKTLESAAGIVRNNKSAAIMERIYRAQIAKDVNVNYGRLFDSWNVEQGVKSNRFVNRFDKEMRNKFDQEVMTELQYRYHDGVESHTSSPAVKELADHIDRSSEKALKILQGQANEIAVRGSENLNAERGWFRQVWDGAKFTKMISDINKRGLDGKKAIEDALANSYIKLHNMAEDEARVFAKAVIRRAIANERGVDTNVMRMLDEEGTDYAIEFLTDSGVSKADATKMIDSLAQRQKDNNKQSFLKARKDVDLRDTIPGTDLRLMDLIDHDIVGTWTKYSRRASGAASLARHGIQRADRRDIINAIKDEENANGGRTLSDDELEGIFSYFEGGPLAGGVNPWVRRANQITNLSLLNQLGLTQGAETGAQIAAVGMESFMKTAPKELKDILEGKASPAMQEMSDWSAAIDGEHMLFRDDLFLDEIRNDPGVLHELGGFLDKLLIPGSRVQGYVSGFYKMKQTQQRIAMRSMMHRLGRMFKDGSALSDNRLYDIGLGGKTADRVGKYFQNGTVEFGPDGDILKLNFQKWKPDDVQDFAAAMNRHVYQVCQEAMRGETSVWMHKDMGAILMHLKSFTMVSIQKQLLRNARIMDGESAMAFIYGLGTAGLAYTAKQAINGRTDKLDPEDIVKGAFGMSNMTGAIPMWTDPMASFLGMDNLRINHYGTQGVTSDIWSPPPMYSTLNKMAHVPEAATGIVTGTYKNEDIQALQAIPIIGNLYGFQYIFNKMKRDQEKGQ